MVLLDNMTPDEVRACVALARDAAPAASSWRCPVASRSRTIARTPTPAPISISTSVITQSAPALDIGFDIDAGRSRHGPRTGIAMLLAIDCGNTQTVIGLFDDRELVDHWRIATAAERTSDELALMFQQFLAFEATRRRRSPGMVIGSGVPRVTAALREMSERYFGFPAVVLEPA